MIVSEEDLKPYRNEYGTMPLRGSRYNLNPLPKNFFADTKQVFRDDWPDSPNPLENLEIVLVLAFAGSVPIWTEVAFGWLCNINAADILASSKL